MTDEPEVEFAPEGVVIVGPGETHVLDADYLDPAGEVEGVLAVQADAEGGLWALYGLRDAADGYHQVWFQPGRTLPVAPSAKGRGPLRPVS
ncbi:hypothetical protein [Pseudoxanthomonas koreensis]|uniref:hypothetical protein n=1 Tax=Pseudoxanthomonas koreensis TaxID=266061 RepID=UPI001390E47C|nr:hypothetical protein [Pseudoxanthomonas koreensis]KAF1692667.1 hypothetical protein CSC64_06675 [Pseudoxanthomonas koreensis]